MASSGNFCTLNPLTQPNAGTFKDGNLYFIHTASAWRTTAGTHGMTSGKWYWEAYQISNLSGNGFPVGIYDMDSGKFVSNQASDYLGQATSTYGNQYSAYTNSGTYAEKRNNGSNTNMTLSIGAGGDVWQCALDIDNGKIWFGKNNSWDNSGNPATGSNASFTSVPTTTWVPVTCSYSNSNSEDYPQNFGQDSTFAGRITAGGNADENGFGDFKYPVPAGFKAICSGNLPISDDIDPAQTDADIPTKQNGAITYTGNGSTQSITGLGFNPGLVWGKMRSPHTYNNMIYDSTRGVGKDASSDRSAAEFTLTNGVTSFDSDGFSIGDESSMNDSGDPIVAWCWRANGGSTSANSNGNIASVTQANDKAGFSIVTYTGTRTSNGTDTVGHGLATAPEFITHHSLNRTAGKWAQHIGTSSASHIMQLSGTAAETDYSSYGTMSRPTNSVFSINNIDGIGYSATYVSYCWHSVVGYSKFGTYVGNGNADGPFIYTGFKPSIYFVKVLDATNNWFTYDDKRLGYNGRNDSLNWNSTAVEDNTYQHDIVSNGFKIRDSNNATNQSGKIYIYGSWASVPFRYNNTR